MTFPNHPIIRRFADVGVDGLHVRLVWMIVECTLLSELGNARCGAFVECGIYGLFP